MPPKSSISLLFTPNKWNRSYLVLSLLLSCIIWFPVSTIRCSSPHLYSILRIMELTDDVASIMHYSERASFALTGFSLTSSFPRRRAHDRRKRQNNRAFSLSLLFEFEVPCIKKNRKLIIFFKHKLHSTLNASGFAMIRRWKLEQSLTINSLIPPLIFVSLEIISIFHPGIRTH